MRLAGKKLEKPNEEVVVFPRLDGDIVIIARAVMDYSDFDKLCPEPVPPKILRPGPIESLDLEDPEYKKARSEWASHKFEWLILKSLEATTDLEWETVKFNDPETWKNYLTELRDAHFSDAEIGRIINAVSSANSLDDAKLEAARDRFLAGRQEVLSVVSSQKEEQ